MPEFIGPAIARDRVRTRLRELREARSLQVGEVERAVHWPASALVDVESGTRLIEPLELETVLSHYGCDDSETIELVRLVRIARTPLSQGRHQLTGEYLQFAGYESEASRITHYQPLIVPGLLQTTAYALAATATILGAGPTDSDVVAVVQVRRERQRVVESRLATDDLPAIVAIVDEVVLRRRIGGDDVMREQLEHLSTQAARAHVELIIMPTAVGGHVGLGGVFELLEFPDSRDDDLVFIESATGDTLSRDPEVTTRYRGKADRLRATGLSEDNARSLIQQVLDGR
ncbi:helix-turn-helix domain-containing protein [Actinoplanes friuliensis]|uniref:XRE family transcriptional regulator n=1 Tax=Actinoplanes friuliensis DSM 7358 TaxID=1246995 RepID=U5VXH9_9ACTN|nr:helix-turn-helix transcriptional regulator [Actinoplanes friuliensis]AGZ40440.1 XRE family transcriptional regulator [Actinoplanes friuliensis DSM 7358]